MHPGHFPSREGENERRPISCAHSSWIKRSTLLCRKMTWVHPVVSFPLFLFFARGARVSLAGVLLYISFFVGPLEMGSPGHEHVDLGLHSYPCARLRNWSRQTSWRYSVGTTMLFRQYPLGTVLILSPRETTAWALKCTRDRPRCQTGPSRVPLRAQSQAVFPRAGYESKVTSVIE